jgi:outer membrane receptor protein involved in Fe transport
MMKDIASKRVKLLSSSILGLVLALPAPVAAQVAAPVAENSLAVPGEILVTARRKAENQRDVPVAISAVSGDQLVRANIAVIRDLVVSQPALYFSYGSAAPFTLIRGFGSGSNISFDQAVGKFIDNVAYNRDQDARIPLFDLERVEVLKGPQVLLYGTSTTAGALNITTKRPGDELTFDMSSSYEFNNNETLLQGGLTVPLHEMASVRVAGYLQHLDKGWVRNDLTGKSEPRDENYAIRGTLKLAPAPDLTIYLKAEYDDIQQKGGILQPYAQTVIPAVAFPEIELDGRRSVSNAGAPYGVHDFFEMNNQVYQGDLQWKLAGATVASTTAYRRSRVRLSIDPDGSQFAIFESIPNVRFRQFSHETRVFGTAGPVEYVVGGYYEWSGLNIYNPAQFNIQPLGAPVPPVGRMFTLDQVSRTYSGYVDLTYSVTDAFSVEAGIRYSKINKTADQSAYAYTVVPGADRFSRSQFEALRNSALDSVFSRFGGAPHAFVGLKNREDHWQPQIVAKYKLDSRSMVYAKYVKGAKAGGFDNTYSGVNPAQARFASEAAESFEIGAKGLLLGNQLEYAVDAFRTTFTDLQVSVFDGISTFLVSNVGKARTQGIEAELTWRPTRALSINLNGAYLDAKYISFPGVACYYAQQAATPAGQICRQDLSGTRTPMSSKWSGGIKINHEHEIGSGDLVMLESLELFARSRFMAGTINNPAHYQDGFAQINGQIGVTAGNGGWELALFGKNLTDKQFKEFAAQTVLTSGGEQAAISRGRQIGLRFGVRY